MIGDTARQRTTRRVLAAVLLGAAGALFFGSSSSAYVSCSLDPMNASHVLITLSASSTDDVKIDRTAGAPGNLQVTSNAAPTASPTCALITLQDISLIKVSLATTPDMAAQSVTIDLSHGAFAPGSDADPGGDSEIEFDINLGNSTADDKVIIIGGAGNENIVFGTTGGGTHNANFNANETTDDADADFFDVEQVEVTGGGGDDMITGAGGSDTGNAFGLPLKYKVTSTTPDGNDSFTGGAMVDTMDYSGRTSTAVSVIVDGIANDGSGAETDNIDVENLVGSGAGDYFEGTQGTATSGTANNFDGGGGSDEVNYGDRTNTVTVTIDGTANDGTGENDNVTSTIEKVTGGSGNDNLTGHATNATTLNGGAGTDTLTGGGGTDTLNGEAGNDTLNGGGGADTLNGGDAVDTLNGDGGNDTLNGEAGNDTLNGGTEDDALNGGAGGDTMDGGGQTSADTASYSDRTASVNLSLDGTANDGETGENDNLSNIENLTGGPANDTLDGDNGTQRLDGGGGTDTVTYANATAGVTVDLGVATAQTTGGDGSDTLVSIENLTGSDFADRLGGSTGNNVIEGNNGIDIIDYNADPGPVVVDLQAGTAAGDGSDTLLEIENARGTDANDRLSGTTGVNTLYGELGDDILNGRAGTDTLNGGEESPPTVPPANGVDSASYADASAAVTVDIDDSTENAGEAVGDTLVSIEGAEGSAFNDLLSGDENRNILSGLAGTDTINGRAGDDTLKGGAGNDVLSAGTGVDEVDYTGVSADLVVDLSLVQPTATGEGTDTLTSIQNVIGGSGDDTIVGDSLANELVGGDGDDTFEPGPGLDELTGGNGSDTVDYSTSTDPITANLTTETGGADGDASDTDQYDTIENLTGSPQNDMLTGGSTANVLRGLAGDDDFNGQDGNDTLIGDAGADELLGGNGTDTADYSTAGTALTIDLRTPANNTGGDAAGDTYSNTAISTKIENVTGSPQNDTIQGDGNANGLDGGAGTDTVTFDDATAGVTADLAVGTATGDGNDTLVNFENLTGSPHNDILGGNASDNVLLGNGGTDNLTFANAGAGVDVDLAAGTATGAGTDTVSGFLNVIGSPQADLLRGTSGNNVITGGGGTDTVSYSNVTGSGVTVSLRTTTLQTTGAGDDTITQVEGLTGSQQDDTLAGDGGNNTINGAGGTDTLTFAAATGSVTANLTTGLATGDGSDSFSTIENLTGSPQGDTLAGNGSANTLNGGGGDDTLNGGGGNDTETGGDGNDSFFQESASNGGDDMTGGAGTDRVTYSSRTTVATVSFDNVANDGEAGEGDNARSDIEIADLATLPPTAPTNVKATAGKALATVTWTAPSNNGGAPVTGYTVTSTPDGKTASTGSAARSATVVGLRNGVTYTFTVTATNSAGTGAVSAPSNAVTPTDPAAGQGYALLGDDGGVFSFGAAGNFGSIPGLGLKLNEPPIGMAYTPTGQGYWIVARDGGIFSFGDAKFFGSMGGTTLNSPVLGMEPTPTGAGYWLFAGDGGIFAFGDAKFFGSMGGTTLNAPVVGMGATSTGKGYWLVAQDGGIFSFGDAKFFGSMGGTTLNQPVFDMAPAADNAGYWLVARDGGIFNFGSAKFFGSAAPANPATVIGIGTSPAGNGYWIADQKGVTYAFGDATALGDLRGLGKTVVSFAALPKQSQQP